MGQVTPERQHINSAVRALRRVLERQQEPVYPVYDLDGSYFVPITPDIEDDPVLVMVARRFGISPTDLYYASEIADYKELHNGNI